LALIARHVGIRPDVIAVCKAGHLPSWVQPRLRPGKYLIEAARS
jgi:hypothetical protein